MARQCGAAARYALYTKNCLRVVHDTDYAFFRDTFAFHRRFDVFDNLAVIDEERVGKGFILKQN